MESLQDQLNNVQSKLNAERELGGQKDNDKITALEAQEAELTIQVAQHREQELETRVQEQVQTQGYLLDTLTASNGFTMAELSYSPENHELVCIAVQKAFLAQQDAFNNELKGVEQTLEHTTELLRLSYAESDRQAATIFNQDLEINDLDKRLKNAANIIDEKDVEIKGLKEQQINAQALEVAPLSAEEQETKLINELNGKRIKVINMHPKTSEFNNKLFVATNAITGVEFEDYILYSKRYEEISLEEAAQLQADYRAKKEEIAKLTEIPELEVIQDIAPIEEQADTQPEEVGTAELGLAEESPQDNREVDAEEEELDYENIEVVFTLAHVRQLRILEERVEALEQKLV